MRRIASCLSIFALASLVSVAGAGAAGCSAEPSGDGDVTDESSQELASSPFIWPGRSIGVVRLGATYAHVKQAIGPATAAFGANNVVLALYPAKGIEIVFSSSQPTSLSDDARVVSIGTSSGAPPIAGGPPPGAGGPPPGAGGPPPGAGGPPPAPVTFTGFVRPGQTRATIEATWGAGEPAGDVVYYPYGFAVRYPSADASAIASSVSVFRGYRIETKPAEMTGPWPWPRRSAPLDLGGKGLGTVDMHLHPGYFGRIPLVTKGFFASAAPPFLRMHVPAVTSEALDPWAPNLGIRAQTDLAGVDHAVLYAVYTQKTTGFLTNEDVEAMVTSPRNRAADGLPWAFAFASVNFFDGWVRADGTVDPVVSARRLAALSGYFERRRDLFIGIKLAHAHQAVAFDDPRYLGVYDVAAKYRVPVYLHTGFTPFPGGKNTPAYYDPQGLVSSILNNPSVTFVLGHVGQGDARAVEHALSLAEAHANVYLEISALGRPLLVDDDGDALPPDPTKPQLPFVLEQIKARGLVGKTLYGSDGPQSAGMVKSYTTLAKDTMAAKGYSAEEIAAVMGGNFRKVYFAGQ